MKTPFSCSVLLMYISPLTQLSSSTWLFWTEAWTSRFHWEAQRLQHIHSISRAPFSFVCLFIMFTLRCSPRRHILLAQSSEFHDAFESHLMMMSGCLIATQK
jgi:hypothetical protein